jgi:hypothetical protein
MQGGGLSDSDVLGRRSLVARAVGRAPGCHCGPNRERAGVTGGRRQRPIDVVDRAVAEPRLTGVIGPVASTMTSAGGVTRGGLVSN